MPKKARQNSDVRYTGMASRGIILPSGPAAQRPSGPAAQRPSGPAAQRPSGPAAQRPSGPAAQRPSGPAAQRPSGVTCARRLAGARSPAPSIPSGSSRSPDRWPGRWRVRRLLTPVLALLFAGLWLPEAHAQPAAPTNLVVAVDSGQLAVSWDMDDGPAGLCNPNSNTCYHVLHYTSSTTVADNAEASGNDAAAAWIAAFSSTTRQERSFTITGLSNGTPYRVRVASKTTTSALSAGPSEAAHRTRTSGSPRARTRSGRGPR